ncbi:MAG: dTMP kinase [Chloroflexota bacterium]
MLITFEGPEGAGKSTQAMRLAALLEAEGRSVILTREPGGTRLGDRVRQILLEEPSVVSAEAEAYLMTGARAEHVRKVIGPALDRGSIVIVDRFADSTLAYQGAGRGLDEGALRDLQSLALNGVEPDLTILLDIDVEQGLLRKTAPDGRNKLDDEPVDFHRRVLAWYRAEARRQPGRWRIVDSSLPVDTVHDQILDHVKSYLDLDPGGQR